MKKYRNFKFQPLVLALAGAFGFTSTVHAHVEPEIEASDAVWEYTQKLNSMDGYRAFIATQTNDTPLTQEARSRAISLLGDFDVGILQDSFVKVPSFITGENQTLGVRTAQSSDGSVFQAPFGRRQWTFVDVYVDDQGQLTDENGNFVDVQGGAHTGAPFRVTSGGQLLNGEGTELADDVGILPFVPDDSARPNDPRIGRLSVDDRDFSNFTQNRDVVNRDGTSVEVERANTRARAEISGSQARARAERDAAFTSAALTGFYAG